MKIEIAIDRGGTFTDLVARAGERFVVKKVLSRSPFYEESCSHAIMELLAELLGGARARDVSAVAWVRMGTTIATNALLERKGEPTALAVTKGFADLLRIGDQSRPDIFALEIEKPEPLCEEVVEIDERVFWHEGRFDAEKTPDEREVRLALGRLRVKNLAVCLMHGYGHPVHERVVAEAAEKLGFRVVCSHEISPMPGALQRAETTLVDAYLTPKLEAYLRRFVAPFEGDIGEKTRMMQSDGTLCKIADFRGSRALLSGPAGGVSALRSLYDGRPLIGFDMGGTSTDVSRYDGAIALRFESVTAGVRVRVPQVDLHTVASGGGSRLFYENGLFRVGPESSGAEPGPLCYGRGGYLSVTDANLVTGRIDPQNFPKIFGPAGDAPLDVEAARAGFAPIAEKVGRSVEEVAEAFLEVADEQMARAVREVTLKKGYDPADHVLCAFGGAGGQHAVSVAARLGVKEVLVPRFAGILSAWGMAVADESADAAVRVQKPLQECGEEVFAPLKSALAEKLADAEVTWHRYLTLRYEGTDNAIEVPFERAREAFEAAHRREFGYLMPERLLLVESARLVALKKSRGWHRPRIAEGSGRPQKVATGRLFLEGAWHEAVVYRMESLGAGDRLEGPALVVQETSTILLRAGCEATVTPFGDLQITLKAVKRRETDIEAARLALLSNRFAFIASRMGEALQRSAVSTNIKERLDFSCAIFDAEGNLVANAPHIPVHLGSMSSVVKALIGRGEEVREGVQFVTNAPWEGGSHLPDITVVAPCVVDGKVRFWVASRGHHADIGGSVPGSMPPFSRRLEEEGAVFESFPLIEAGRFAEKRVRDLLESAGARRVEDNLSDLRAQAAANLQGIAGVLALMEEEREEIERYMRRIQSVSEEAVRAFLKERAGAAMEGSDRLDNGADVALRVAIDEAGGATFDFSGSSPELFGNQNTPPAVVRSAVVYALRAMVRRDLPLNEGILAPVRLLLPEKSLLNPSPGAAVSGGNVTTSQRIVDLILGLFGEAAASQGCMNNVTFGDGRFGYYETVGGGAGATPRGPGADAVHTHMTNTRITDVEILEQRYPVAIERFAIRRGSGGAGEHPGGDGIVRVYRFFAPLEFSIISERRVFAPFGLDGGGPGARGRNLLIREGSPFYLASREWLRVRPGDRIVIETPGGGGFGNADGRH